MLVISSSREPNHDVVVATVAQGGNMFNSSINRLVSGAINPRVNLYMKIKSCYFFSSSIETKTFYSERTLIQS